MSDIEAEAATLLLHAAGIILLLFLLIGGMLINRLSGKRVFNGAMIYFAMVLLLTVGSWIWLSLSGRLTAAMVADSALAAFPHLLVGGLLAERFSRKSRALRQNARL